MTINDLKDKYIFWDLDGTLSEYRFNNHVNGKSGLGGQSLKELLFEDVFLNNRPLKTMINVIKQLDPNKQYILGAICTNYEMEQKYKWLEIHYPFILKNHIIFVCSSDLKVQVLEEYRQMLKLNYCDIIFVDDKHKTIQDTEDAGFTSYHITSFMH